MVSKERQFSPASRNPRFFNPRIEREESSPVKIPVIKMPPLQGIEEGIDYSKTERFMQNVTVAGPKEGLEMFVKGHEEMAKFRRQATTAFAIETICSGPRVTPIDVWNERVGATKSARSVRYRRYLTQQISYSHLIRALEQNSLPHVCLVSIASGTGSAPLEVIRKVEDVHADKTRAVLIDKDKDAVEESRRIKARLKLNGHIKIIEASYPRINRYCEEASADIVDAVGIGDYLDDEKCLRLFKTARKLVARDGIFVFTNIAPTLEKPYLDIVWHPMFYRTPKELAQLAEKGGFDPEKTSIILDPGETMQTLVAKP